MSQKVKGIHQRNPFKPSSIGKPVPMKGVVIELDDGRRIEVTPTNGGDGIEIRGVSSLCAGQLVVLPRVSNSIVVRFAEDV